MQDKKFDLEEHKFDKKMSYKIMLQTSMDNSCN